MTIEVLKLLTANSLEIFGQVSHRWRKFLKLTEQSSSQPLSQPILKRNGVMNAGGLTPRKRLRILPLNKVVVSAVASEQALLKALRTVLRDDHAHGHHSRRRLCDWLQQRIPR